MSGKGEVKKFSSQSDELEISCSGSDSSKTTVTVNDYGQHEKGTINKLEIGYVYKLVLLKVYYFCLFILLGSESDTDVEDNDKNNNGDNN
jgi:hypothetical protein